MSTRPTIALIATGGTIAGRSATATDTAGYTAGSVPVAELTEAVPQLAEVAEVQAEQLCNLDSKDMTPALWLQLAHRARSLLADPRIAGVVITHGTDTMEETACFLDLVLDAAKPVVLTGSMRPASALSADGPMNLYDAVRTAADPASAGRGVLLVVADSILPTRGLRKLRFDRLEAFSALGGAEGRTRPRVHYFRPPAARAAAAPALPALDAQLPRVDVLFAAAGSSPDCIDTAIASGARGLVLALPGNGSLPDAWIDAVRRAVHRGIPVLRASRCGQGEVTAREVDRETGSWSAGSHSAAAARVVLMLGLATCEHEDLAAFVASSRGESPPAERSARNQS